jgi:hypothetical protein
VRLGTRAGVGGAVLTQSQPQLVGGFLGLLVLLLFLSLLAPVPLLPQEELIIDLRPPLCLAPLYSATLWRRGRPFCQA